MKTTDRERDSMSEDSNPRGRAGHRTRRERIRDRDAEAANLRSVGHSFAVIAEKMGYADASGARKAVYRVLDRNAWEPVEEARLLELARLDQLHRAAWHIMRTAPTPAMQLQAVKSVLSVMERRTKLLGLDTPTRHERWNHQVETQAPESMFEEEINRLTRELAVLDQQQGRDAGGTSVSDPDELEEARRAAGL